MVDWNSLLNCNETRQKVRNVTINEGGAASARELFNDTAVDIVFYLSKAYRDRILQKVADEANKYYNELM